MIGGKLIADILIVCKAFELNDDQTMKIFSKDGCGAIDWNSLMSYIRKCRDNNASMKREYGR